MGRVTRKMAAEVAEAVHIDEDEVLASGSENAPSNAKELLHLAEQQHDRAPLGELEPNSAENTSVSDDTTPELRKSTRGGRKGTKKGAKGKKHNLAASTATQRDASPASGDEPEVLPDDDDRTPSPASERAAADLMKDASTPDIPVSNTKGANRSAKVTRSRSAAKEKDVPVEPKSLIDGIGQERDSMKEEYTIGIPTITHAENTAMTGALPIDAPASPLPDAVPKSVARLRADTPAKRSTSNKENIQPQDMDTPSLLTPTSYDTLEQAVVAAASPQAVTPPQPQQHEDPIAALDNLDEAVENVNRDIPDILSSPEKPKSKKESIDKKLSTTTTSKKAAPVVRPTKASQARISLSQNPDASTRAPTLGRPRPSATLGRSTSVRQSESPGKRVPSGTKSPTDGGDKKEVIIPHSKPRPMSMSFPAPFQPTKSAKAPTQSTFQLPGEAVAAKLKAAREARMQKEAEEKKTFKARPVPSSLSKAPSVRQTTASKARESIMAGRDLKTAVSNSSANASTSGHKRAQSVATSRPSVSTKPRVPSNSAGNPAKTTSRPTPSTSTLKPRPMTALANTSTTTASKPRTSFASSTMSTRPNGTAPGTASGTSKGKEVFNRPAAAKAAAEKEKLEKEAAAKKARAEAAERGRQASREWAEKQKKLAAAKKAAVVSPSNGDEGAVVETAHVETQQVVEASQVSNVCM